MSIRSGWNKFDFLFPLLIALIASLPSQGQVVGVSRFEIPAEPAFTEAFKVYPIRDQGLLLYRKLLSSAGAAMEVIRVDTSMKPVWKQFIPIDQNFFILRQAQNNSITWFLLRNAGNTSFQTVAVNNLNGDFQVYPIYNIIRMNTTEFAVTPNSFWIGGHLNYRPLVIRTAMATGETSILPGMPNEPGELMQVRAHVNGNVEVVVGAKNQERQNTIWIRSYGPYGNLNKTVKLDPGPKKNLLFGQLARGSSEEQVVAGVYGRFSNFSRGIYLAAPQPEGEYQVNYYNFGDLQNFFNYKKPRQVRRIKERIERRKLKGRKIKFSYRLLVHDIIPYHNQFILVAEAYYPTYKYPSFGSSYGFGDPYRSNLIFDGYQFTHAVVVGFSRDGKILWDNCFELNDIKSFQLEKYVKVQPVEGRLVLNYIFQNTLRSKVIQQDEVLEGKTIFDLSDLPGEKNILVESTEAARVDYWYDHYFFMSSLQYVKDRLSQGSQVRKVFAITKFTYP